MSEFTLASKKDVERILEEVKKLSGVLYSFGKYPLDFIPHSRIIREFLRRGRVIIVDVPENVMTAGTDGIFLIINKQFWDGLPTIDKAFTLIHEADHIIKEHPFRQKPNHRLWNYAGDAVINSQVINVDELKPQTLTPYTREIISALVKKHADKLPKRLAQRVAIDVLDPSKYSDEDIYALLVSLSKKIPEIGEELKKIAESPKTMPKDVYAPGELGKKLGKKVVEGTLGGKPLSPKEIKKMVEETKKMVEEAKNVQRAMAGTMPSGMSKEYEVNQENCRSPIDWRDVVRNAFSGLGMNVVSTWLKPSRRHPSYPGYKMYGPEKMVILIDVSGSIDKSQLSRFLSEIQNIINDLGYVKIHYVLWDVDIVTTGEAYNLDEVHYVITHNKRGGGTLIRKALEYASEIGDISSGIVVMTDGWIGDIYHVKDYLDNCHSTYGASVVLSTGIIPEPFKESGWTVARLPPPKIE